MKNCAVSDGYLFADIQGIFFPRDMQHTVVLHVRAGADPDGIHVAPDNGPEPDARAFIDNDVTEYDDIGGNKYRRMNFGVLAFVWVYHRFKL
jgi:hypothetical protein